MVEKIKYLSNKIRVDHNFLYSYRNNNNHDSVIRFFQNSRLFFKKLRLGMKIILLSYFQFFQTIKTNYTKVNWLYIISKSLTNYSKLFFYVADALFLISSLKIDILFIFIGQANDI